MRKTISTNGFLKRVEESKIIPNSNKNNLECQLPNFENSYFQKNQQNLVFESKFDEPNDRNIGIKSVNWKLQKLEKDFLLSYIESAIQRYNKHACTTTWLSGKNKDYFTKLLGSKRYKSQTIMVPCKPQMKHKSTQTHPIEKDFSGFLNVNSQEIYKFINLLKNSIDMNTTRPLLELKSGEIKKLHAVLIQMFPEEKNFKFDRKNKEDFQNKTNKDKKNSDSKNQFDALFDEYDRGLEEDKKLNEMRNVSHRLSEQYDSQKETLRFPDIETEDLFDDKSKEARPDKKHRNKDDFFPNEVTDLIIENDRIKSDQDLSRANLMDSSNIRNELNENLQGNIKQNDENRTPHFNDELDAEYIYTVDMKGSTQNFETDENFKKIEKIIRNSIGQTDGKIVTMLLNKTELVEFLLIIMDIIKNIQFKLPLIDGMTPSLLEKLSSIQAEAKLSRMTNEMDPGEEILFMYGKICDFIDENQITENSLQSLVDSVKSTQENVRKYISKLVQEVVETPVLLSYTLSLIYHKYHHIDNYSLISFFNSLPKYIERKSSESGSVKSKSTRHDSFYDSDLLSSVLAIIQIWNGRNIYKHITEPSQDMRIINTDIETLKKWLLEHNFSLIEPTEDDLMVYTTSEIYSIYKEFVKASTEVSNSKVLDNFQDPHKLLNLISKIHVTHEIILKTNNVFRNLQSHNIEKYFPNTISKKQEDLINELLSNEELIHQVLAIVDYWVAENGQEVSTSFDGVESLEILFTYKLNKIKYQFLPAILSKVIIWLHNFIKDADPEDTPQDIIDANFYSTNIYLLKDYLQPDPFISTFFKNPNSLLELLYKLHNFIRSAIISKLNFSDDFDLFHFGNRKSDRIERTEPITTTPVISIPENKNLRFSNSQADNKERFSQDNLESTYINVSSLMVVKNNLENETNSHVEERTLEDSAISDNNELLNTNPSYSNQDPNIHQDQLITANVDNVEQLKTEDNLSVHVLMSLKVSEDKSKEIISQTFYLDDKKIKSSNTSDEPHSPSSGIPEVHILEDMDRNALSDQIIQQNQTSKTLDQMDNKDCSQFTFSFNFTESARNSPNFLNDETSLKLDFDIKITSKESKQVDLSMNTTKSKTSNYEHLVHERELDNLSKPSDTKDGLDSDQNPNEVSVRNKESLVENSVTNTKVISPVFSTRISSKKTSCSLDHKTISDKDSSKKLKNISPPLSLQTSPPLSEKGSKSNPTKSKEKDDNSLSSSSIVLQKYEIDSQKELLESDFIDEYKMSETNLEVPIQIEEFNSQMNTLSSRLDDAIASINLYYVELEDLKTNCSERPSKEPDMTTTKEDSNKLGIQDIILDDPLKSVTKVRDFLTETVSKDVSINKSNRLIMQITSEMHISEKTSTSSKLRNDKLVNEYQIQSGLSPGLNKDVNINTTKHIPKLSENVNLKSSSPIDRFNLAIDTILASVEMQQHELRNMSMALSTLREVVQPPETLEANLFREPPEEKLEKGTKEEDEIINTISFIIYYLMTIMARNNMIS